MVLRSALRREQLGLTREEVAWRAGMSLAYLRHLEDLGADFDPGGLMRLAAALEMSYEELVEGRTDNPPGRTPAAAHPVLMKLSERECWDRLDTHGVGRLGLSVDSKPVLVPVNYLVDGRTIVYRTDRDGVAAAAAGAELAFEVDRIDDARSGGWSVLVVGTVEHIDESEVIRRLMNRLGVEPWAGGKRDLWVRVVPSEVSGRTIRAA
ncbi:pyridoxamine 5'-phosphate oxidase family protein [Streptomyces olivoreticuli]